MDYYLKSWESEDEEFSPKRKINNKGSDKIPFIIGSFYSSKMQRTIEYNSWNECIFYFLLELDKLIIRYYVQPVEVEVPYLGGENEKRYWTHIPDVLFFREGSVPVLCQIKDINYEITEKFNNANKACIKYSEARGWGYSIIYPKQLPKEMIRNLKLLVGFTKKRDYYDAIIPELLTKLETQEKSTIIGFAESYEEKIDIFGVLPVIYHLISIGSIYTNPYLEINRHSEISIGSISRELSLLVKVGGFYEK